MNIFTIDGTYGASNTTCDVFVYEKNGGYWYCVEGGTMVNFTYDEMPHGVDVETLQDSDCFTWSSPIESESDLEMAVDE